MDSVELPIRSITWSTTASQDAAGIDSPIRAATPSVPGRVSATVANGGSPVVLGAACAWAMASVSSDWATEEPWARIAWAVRFRKSVSAA